MKSSLRVLYLEDDRNDVELAQAKLEEAGVLLLPHCFVQSKSLNSSCLGGTQTWGGSSCSVAVCSRAEKRASIFFFIKKS